MKLDCPRRDLFEAATAAANATSARTTVAILQHVKLDASDGGVRVLGCDGEIWVERKFPSMVDEAGSICLQASLLKDIVSSMPDGDLELKTLEGQGALLVQQNSEYRLQTLDPGDFPETPEYGGEGELTLPMGLLRNAIDSVIYAVSTDNHRQILTGVLISYDGQTLTLVATDTHRLAVRRIDQPGIGSNISVVVPEKALRALKAMPLADTDPITLRFGGGKLGAEAHGAKVITQLLTGVYPSWDRVVPSETTRRWDVEADQLLEKVRRTLILAKDNANRVKFKGSDDQVQLSARSDEKGEAKEEVQVLSENGVVEIAFNGKYVMDFLQAVDSLKTADAEGAFGVRIEMTESSRPAVFRPRDIEGYFCVIMPMNLS